MDKIVIEYDNFPGIRNDRWRLTVKNAYNYNILEKYYDLSKDQLEEKISKLREKYVNADIFQRVY